MRTLTMREGAADALKDSAGVVTDSELAAHMEISKSLISRVFAGKSAPGATFIASVLMKFPAKFEDVFEPIEKAA